MIKGMIENKKLMIFCDVCKIKNESQGIFFWWSLINQVLTVYKKTSHEKS